MLFFNFCHFSSIFHKVRTYQNQLKKILRYFQKNVRLTIYQAAEALTRYKFVLIYLFNLKKNSKNSLQFSEKIAHFIF